MTSHYLRYASSKYVHYRPLRQAGLYGLYSYTVATGWKLLEYYWLGARVLLLFPFLSESFGIVDGLYPIPQGLFVRLLDESVLLV